MSNAKDFATGKPIKAGNPEEIIRQEYEQVLIDDYGYKKEEIDIEVPITRGTRTRDRADIVIYNSSSGRDPAADILDRGGKITRKYRWKGTTKVIHDCYLSYLGCLD